jgi:hypothetical protein
MKMKMEWKRNYENGEILGLCECKYKHITTTSSDDSPYFGQLTLENYSKIVKTYQEKIQSFLGKKVVVLTMKVSNKLSELKQELSGLQDILRMIRGPCIVIYSGCEWCVALSQAGYLPIESSKKYLWSDIVIQICNDTTEKKIFMFVDANLDADADALLNQIKQKLQAPKDIKVIECTLCFDTAKKYKKCKQCTNILCLPCYNIKTNSNKCFQCNQPFD